MLHAARARARARLPGSLLDFEERGAKARPRADDGQQVQGVCGGLLGLALRAPAPRCAAHAEPSSLRPLAKTPRTRCAGGLKAKR